MRKLTPVEWSVFCAIITEPGDWTSETLAEDLGLDAQRIARVLSYLYASGVIARRRKLVPTQKGKMYADEIGIVEQKPDPTVTREHRVHMAYVNLPHRQGGSKAREIAERLRMDPSDVAAIIRDLNLRGIIRVR